VALENMMNIHNDLQKRGGKESKTLISQIFENHQEAIVITLDPDDDNSSESKIGVFTKLVSNDSKLSAVLEQILLNLQRTLDGKSRSSSLESKTAPQKDQSNCEGPENSAGSGETICCKNC